VKPKIGVITFPGSLDDRDALRAIGTMGGEAVPVWHRESTLSGVDAVILPGGFSYGDYLRTGAIARFAPVMDPVREFAADGRAVLGICNGFQILCEAGLLPGALIRNRGLSYVCRWIHAKAETFPLREGESSSTFTEWPTDEVLHMPVKHGEGQFVATPEELEGIEADGLVALRYCSPDGTLDDGYVPNGSTHAIAGVRNREGNVLGMMPHPEHAVDPDLGPTGGQQIFQWLLSAAGRRVPV
jgi:phosphoribosylformylglycinamidine synthase subunit PurQ / glutaminase